MFHLTHCTHTQYYSAACFQSHFAGRSLSSSVCVAVLPCEEEDHGSDHSPDDEVQQREEEEGKGERVEKERRTHVVLMSNLCPTHLQKTYEISKCTYQLPPFAPAFDREVSVYVQHTLKTGQEDTSEAFLSSFSCCYMVMFGVHIANRFLSRQKSYGLMFPIIHKMPTLCCI